MEQLVDLWPRIRQDVKAVNRRIEALLSEADPAFVVGSTVTVATPYEFHRDKINSDDVRAVVEEVISRLARSAVRVTCVLRDEVDRLRPAAGPVGAPSRSPVTEAALPTDPEPGPAPGVSEDDELLAARRLQAAKNIFDAEEIDET